MHSLRAWVDSNSSVRSTRSELWWFCHTWNRSFPPILQIDCVFCRKWLKNAVSLNYDLHSIASSFNYSIWLISVSFFQYLASEVPTATEDLIDAFHVYHSQVLRVWAVVSVTGFLKPVGSTCLCCGEAGDYSSCVGHSSLMSAYSDVSSPHPLQAPNPHAYHRIAGLQSTECLSDYLFQPLLLVLMKLRHNVVLWPEKTSKFQSLPFPLASWIRTASKWGLQNESWSSEVQNWLRMELENVVFHLT